VCRAIGDVQAVLADAIDHIVMELDVVGIRAAASINVDSVPAGNVLKPVVGDVIGARSVHIEPVVLMLGRSTMHVMDVVAIEQLANATARDACSLGGRVGVH